MYDFDRELMNKYDLIKHRIYVEYCNHNITLKERELLLERAKHDIFNDKFKFIIESDDEDDNKDRAESAKNIIEQKEFKCSTKIRMMKKIVSEKCNIIKESISNIDEEKQSSIHFIFLNRDDEINSIIKILDYIYKNISNLNIEIDDYNYEKEELTEEIEESVKNIKIESYSIATYNNKYKYEISSSDINDYENKYNNIFNSNYLNDLLEKNVDNIPLVKNLYNDFFHWFDILLEYLNWKYNQMVKVVKISEIYKNQLYDDYTNNKNSYSDLKTGTEILKKCFQSVYTEYDDIINFKNE